MCFSESLARQEVQTAIGIAAAEIVVARKVVVVMYKIVLLCNAVSCWQLALQDKCKHIVLYKMLVY